LLGLPRIISTQDDLRWVLDTEPSWASGFTFCAGALGERKDNDVVAMAREFAGEIFFAHLRSPRNSQVAMTTDLYSYVMPMALREAADAMDRIFVQPN
jgi:D-mannonate dehydratase